jgi:FMNH2-dependent dimethyl sulfone monooxygenase
MIYAGGESDAAKGLIAKSCDAYVMHGDPPERIAEKVRDMATRRAATGQAPLRYGVAGYACVRDTEAEVRAELERITNVRQNAAGFANYQQWLSGTQLEQKMSIEEYSVSNRGLRSGLMGTPDQVRRQIGRFEAAGVDLLLLQFSPQLEEMERFSESVIRPLAAPTVGSA